MKRVYSNENKNKKKAELRRLVLAQLTKMRQKIQKDHPGMLSKLRSKMEENEAAKCSNALQDNQHLIDQSKNIESIEKMLDLRESNPAFEKAVRTILSSQKH